MALKRVKTIFRGNHENFVRNRATDMKIDKKILILVETPSQVEELAQEFWNILTIELTRANVI